MDFDSVADELYGSAREDFMATRAARASQAKTDGDRELAAAITRLRKPSIAAWLVNRIAREQPGLLAELAKLGEKLRAAHAELAGDKLRTLSAQRRELLQSLTDEARAIGREAGNAVGEPVADQVWATFEAALTDADIASHVAAGRLDTALTAADAQQWLTAGSAQPAGWDWQPKPRAEPAAKAAPAKQVTKAGGTKAAKGKATKASKDAEAAEAKRRREAETKRQREAIREAKREAGDAATVVKHAERKLANAKDEAKRAAEEVAELRARLARAERAEREARAAITQAKRAADTATREADTAQRKADRLAGGAAGR